MGSYRDLRAWQVADTLAAAVFALADRNWTPQHACIWDQIRRSALSVSLNLAEGHAMGPGLRCRSHFRVAFGSATETAVLLEFLLRLGINTTPLIPDADATKALVYRHWQRSTGG